MTRETIEENRRDAAPDPRLLLYRESSPGAVLDEYVQCFAEFRVDPAQEPFPHRIMPDGCCHVSYLRGDGDPLGSISISGPRMESLIWPLRGGDVCWLFKLRPGACEPLLGIAADELAGEIVTARDAAPRVHAALQSALAACESAEDAWRVFAEAILDWLPSADPVDPIVASGVRRIEETDGGIAISTLASELRISERQFQRRFMTAVGLGPKQFARIRRFRSCVGNMIAEDPEDWGTVAVRHGYADQSHLTREFADLSGLPPTGLEAFVRTIEHTDVNP